MSDDSNNSVSFFLLDEGDERQIVRLLGQYLGCQITRLDASGMRRDGIIYDLSRSSGRGERTLTLMWTIGDPFPPGHEWCILAQRLSVDIGARVLCPLPQSVPEAAIPDNWCLAEPDGRLWIVCEDDDAEGGFASRRKLLIVPGVAVAGGSSVLRRTTHLLHRCEDWVGAFFSAFVCIGVIAFLLFVWTEELSSQPDQTRMTLSGIGLAVAVPLTLMHLYWLWRAMFRQSEQRMALHVAVLQPSWPVVLRPLISLWWLACFAMGSTMVVAYHRAETLGRQRGSGEDAIVTALAAFMGLALAIAANGYLLLAVSAWTKRPAVLDRIWRWRIAYDLALLVVAYTARVAVR